MVTECKKCLMTSDVEVIHADGTCEFCKRYDSMESQADPKKLSSELYKVHKTGRGKKYDCLIGISGGLDSSTMLWAAVKKWGLRPLVIHFDNHYNVPEAKHNMDALVKKLGVDCIVYFVNKREYDALNLSFIRAGVPDADIPNDIAMTKLMYDTAHKYGIKYILNGHDFRTEGSTPAKWTYMDAKYIQSVHRERTGAELTNYPLFTFWDQIKAGIRGIKQVRPFHYIEDRAPLEWAMKDYIDFQEYGGKHCENVYTEFVGAYLLPKFHNIDKRRVYYSAMIRSGKMSKAQAKEKLKTPSEFGKFDQLSAQTKSAITGYQVGDRTSYDRYNFKRYKLLIWILAKVKAVPWTFYQKIGKA